MQELKKREDAAARGIVLFSLNYMFERIKQVHLLSYNMHSAAVLPKLPLLFGSWNCYRGEELATIPSNHSS